MYICTYMCIYLCTWWPPVQPGSRADLTYLHTCNLMHLVATLRSQAACESYGRQGHNETCR